MTNQTRTEPLDRLAERYGDSIESIQLRHVRTVQGHHRDEVCAHDGLAWPCDVALVFTAWDKDSEREIENAVTLTLDRIRKGVIGLRPKLKWAQRYKADDPKVSYDPLLRETAVLALTEGLRR